MYIQSGTEEENYFERYEFDLVLFHPAGVGSVWQLKSMIVLCCMFFLGTSPVVFKIKR
jgi:hypothetical protein